MKRRSPFALSAIMLACAGWTPTATAATEAQKLAAILSGDNHLDTVQAANGAWNGNDAYTGAAVFALLTHQNKWTLAVTGNGGAVTAYPNLTVAKYTADVNSGINFLLNHARSQLSASIVIPVRIYARVAQELARPSIGVDAATQPIAQAW